MPWRAYGNYVHMSDLKKSWWSKLKLNYLLSKSSAVKLDCLLFKRQYNFFSIYPLRNYWGRWFFVVVLQKRTKEGVWWSVPFQFFRMLSFSGSQWTAHWFIWHVFLSTYILGQILYILKISVKVEKQTKGPSMWKNQIWVY